MKKYRLNVLLTFLFVCQLVSAQIFTHVFDENALQFKVKQIDEFFVRFNYETDYKGDKPLDKSDKEAQKKNLLTLFNLDKYSKSNHDVDDIANRFADYIIDNGVKIHYEDTIWCAEAKGTIVSGGKNYDIVFWLKPERVQDVIFRWVITDVESSLFKQFPEHPKDSISISPAEHGIGFITLPETFNLNKSAVGTSFFKGYSRNRLVVFDYLMALGKIKMNPITSVVYHFHLNEADFDVERIEKEKGYNQGWLINKIIIKKEAQHEN